MSVCSYILSHHLSMSACPSPIKFWEHQSSRSFLIFGGGHSVSIISSYCWKRIFLLTLPAVYTGPSSRLRRWWQRDERFNHRAPVISESVWQTMFRHMFTRCIKLWHSRQGRAEDCVDWFLIPDQLFLSLIRRRVTAGRKMNLDMWNVYSALPSDRHNTLSCSHYTNPCRLYGVRKSCAGCSRYRVLCRL